MPQRPLLPLPDYQRIFQVIYSVLNASESANTHRACFFFATAGAMILQEHYKLPASISAGCMALMVDEKKSNVMVYGRNENGVFVNDSKAFHAWVECDGWLIDFMAPIMDKVMREDGYEWRIPRQMLQKPLKDGKANLEEICREGEFFIWHDRSLADSLIDSQPVQFIDLMKVCLAWFRKPPKALADIALADSHGPTKKLVLRAPSIDGVW